MIADAVVGVEEDSIEDIDDIADVHDEPGFLLNLAGGARLQRLANLERSAGQAPLPGERLVLTLDEHDAER